MGDREMGGNPGRFQQKITARLRDVGALAVGVAAAAPVDDATCRRFDSWLARGDNADMQYMAHHRAIRFDPRLLLERGARSIISMAFSYASPLRRDPQLPRISAYALLPDYHFLIKSRIRQAISSIMPGDENEDWRICVDSAPIFERYWAQRAGIGIRGDNGNIIIPGVGSEVILAEVVTTLDLIADTPTVEGCMHCGACRRACPDRALREDGTIDCHHCLSYLTIEHRGEWSDPRHIHAMHTPEGRNTLFGCDRCVKVCPMHRPKSEADLPTPLAEPIEEILSLSPEHIITPYEGLRRILRHSSLSRAKTTDLTRNARNINQTDFNSKI
ncbi:MAG: epoxyqueuosine reductase [Lepagella sp.]